MVSQLGKTLQSVLDKIDADQHLPLPLPLPHDVPVSLAHFYRDFGYLQHPRIKQPENSSFHNLRTA